MSESGPFFFAWCDKADRAEAFVAALPALYGDPPYNVELSSRERWLYEEHRELSLEEVRALVRAHLGKDDEEVRANLGMRLRSGQGTSPSVSSRAESSAARTSCIPMKIWVDDQREFFPPRIEFALGEGPRSASVEAAAIAIDTQGDVEQFLLGLCAPAAGIVTTGACSYCWPWGAPLECNATYHADAASVARDVALSWVHLHDGYHIGAVAGLSLEELAARVEAAPAGARVGIANSLDRVEKHFHEDHEASKSFPTRAPGPELARKGPRPIRPGDEELTREQVLRAIAEPPAALLDALEAAAFPDDEWRAAEPLAQAAIEAKKHGAPTLEIAVTSKHRRFIESHAPYHVRRLSNGGVLLATHPFRTLWPFWADALALLGIRPRGGG
ncbi:hypothetical protein [Polyangium fumosum]|uniref:Uncharacterized protein n=1 Tax=Polyangium fumosum TaxID=889272 RepID=A0A4U1J943_9BACT|nr:hypothetical protein [Polyangium fumosum]TKD04502.1 hypothetical protein E8A74_23115 [Polyangium fumosum]